MKLAPYADAAGQLYPELDWRWVTTSTLATYLGVSQDTAIIRLNRGEYGKIDAANGIRRHVYAGCRRKVLEVRPGLLWQRQRLGRYGAPGWDWRMLEGRVALLGGGTQVVPAAPTAAPAPVVAPGGEALADMLTALAAVVRGQGQQRTLADILPFPAVVQEG